MSTQQTDALQCAADLEYSIARHGMQDAFTLNAYKALKMVRTQQARITELESQLAQRFDAADVATAAAQGFRDGVASLSANAGEPRNAIERDALIDAIAQGLHGTWHCTRAWEAWRVGTMSQDDFEPVDESETPTELADAVLALLAAPPAAQAEGWISVDERLPEPGNPVLLDIGKKYPIRALWAAKNTLRVGTDVDDWGEYDEETDEYYCPEGWYEWNEHEEVHWAVSETPRAWSELPQPLPAATPECLTCSDHGAVGNILTAEPCPDCTRWNVQPAPADSVQEDAARWHWMAEYIVGTRTDLDDEIIASATVDELRKLVDADLAARKQGGL